MTCRDGEHNCANFITPPPSSYPSPLAPLQSTPGITHNPNPTSSSATSTFAARRRISNALGRARPASNRQRPPRCSVEPRNTSGAPFARRAAPGSPSHKGQKLSCRASHATQGSRRSASKKALQAPARNQRKNGVHPDEHRADRAARHQCQARRGAAARFERLGRHGLWEASVQGSFIEDGHDVHGPPAGRIDGTGRNACEEAGRGGHAESRTKTQT